MLSSCPYLLILVLRWAQHPLGGAKQSVLHQVFPTQLINSAATQKSGGGECQVKEVCLKSWNFYKYQWPYKAYGDGNMGAS